MSAPGMCVSTLVLSHPPHLHPLLILILARLPFSPASSRVQTENPHMLATQSSQPTSHLSAPGTTTCSSPLFVVLHQLSSQRIAAPSTFARGYCEACRPFGLRSSKSKVSMNRFFQINFTNDCVCFSPPLLGLSTPDLCSFLQTCDLICECPPPELSLRCRHAAARMHFTPSAKISFPSPAVSTSTP